MPTGGQILIDCLAAHGVQRIYTVAGESFIAMLDAMHGRSDLTPIACRNEAGAAMMAEATGKLTGKPGLALVTRGPGAANAFAGVYIASQDATPMLLLVGLPPRRMAGRAAFQDINLGKAFGGLAKSVEIYDSADSLASMISSAFRTAVTGRPGPVVIGLPEDMLFETALAEPVAIEPAERAGPSEKDLAAIHRLLAGAERPIVLAGASSWSARAARDLGEFAERFDLPVATSFRRQDRLDNRHHCYCGHAGLAIDGGLRDALNIADVVIALGANLGEVETDKFTLLGEDAATRGLKFVIIDADAERFASAYPHALRISAEPAQSAAALATLAPLGESKSRGFWRRDLRAAYEASLVGRSRSESPLLTQIVALLSDALPDDAIITNGAGNYAAFLHRTFRFKGYPTQLAPLSGSMGYGLPAGIAAKLQHPERDVVALCGDGCFQMTSQELATARQFGAGVVVIIANNGSLGTIRMHQEMRYPGRVVATTLANPDFVAFAKSFGASAERVASAAEFSGALDRALNWTRANCAPALIDLKLDLDELSPTASLRDIRGF